MTASVVPTVSALPATPWWTWAVAAMIAFVAIWLVFRIARSIVARAVGFVTGIVVAAVVREVMSAIL